VINRVHVTRASWHKASDIDLTNYKQTLSFNLNSVVLPIDCLLCHSLQCKNTDHKVALSRYAKDIIDACIEAGHKCIPRTGVHSKNNFRTPGWSVYVEPLRQKSLFWHAMWKDCGRPRNGVVADCMRRARASYHYGIRRIRNEEDEIVRRRMAESLSGADGRNFWNEVRKIRHSKANSSGIVDGCHDTSGISQLFSNKYKELYSSVAYDNRDMDDVLVDIDGMLGCEDAPAADCVINVDEVLQAISNMKPNKYDGMNELSSDYVLHAGKDLAVHISFVFLSMIIHGSVPDPVLSYQSRRIRIVM